MFNMLNKNDPWEKSKQPRWVRHLFNFALVLAVAGSVFGLLCLGMIMIE